MTGQIAALIKVHMKRNLFLAFYGFQYVYKTTVNLKIVSKNDFYYFARV